MNKVEISGGDLRPGFLEGLAEMPALEHLVIWGGAVRNADLEPLSRLTGLRHLCLGEMPIDDGVLPYLRNMRALDTLILPYTGIRGDFSPLEGLPLRDIRLEGSRFVGDACAATLARFPTLRKVEIHMTGLTDAGVKLLAGLPLETLWLGPRITDEGMTAMAGIPTLRHIDICAHMVTDEGVAAIVGLRNLEVVWLSRCSVTDASIPVLSGMTGLKELNVNYTGVTPEGMAKLRAALPSTRFVEAD